MINKCEFICFSIANASAVKSESQAPAQEQVNRPTQWQDDSLSSLSIDSEDDTNLLSQVSTMACHHIKYVC